MKFSLRNNFIRQLLTAVLLLSAVNLSLHSLAHFKREVAPQAFSSSLAFSAPSLNISNEVFSSAIHSCGVCESLQHAQAILAIPHPIQIDLSVSLVIEKSFSAIRFFSFRQPSDRAPPRL